MEERAIVCKVVCAKQVQCKFDFAGAAACKCLTFKEVHIIVLIARSCHDISPSSEIIADQFRTYLRR